MVAACVGALSLHCLAQEPAATSSSASKGTTLIGCLAGPDADDHYTLTSMQHRMGVDVVGGDELKDGCRRESEVDRIVGAAAGSRSEEGRRSTTLQGDRDERNRGEMRGPRADDAGEQEESGGEEVASCKLRT